MTQIYYSVKEEIELWKKMPFPTITRVVYRKNPLASVTFQASFGRLLEIDTILPASFQKAIITEFPLLEERDVYRLSIEPHTSEATSGPTESKGRIFDFLSPDKTWKVALSSDYIALTTRKYEKWETFQERLRFVLEHFFVSYTIPLFTRISLKYLNVIDRELLRLNDVPWPQLLRPYIAGEFSYTDIPEAAYVSRQASFRINLEKGDQLFVTHGLVRHKQTNAKGYRLEADFNTTDPGAAVVDAAVSTASRLNRYSGRFFRWAITDKLHEAMEPLEPAAV